MAETRVGWPLGFKNGPGEDTVANYHGIATVRDTTTNEVIDVVDKYGSVSTDVVNTSNLGIVVPLSATATAAQNTLFFKEAIAKLPSSGGTLFLPSGTFEILTGEIQLTKPITIQGRGRPGWKGNVGPTILSVNSATGDGITLLSDGCTLSDFGILNTHASPTEGAGIKVGSITVSANGFDLCRVSSRGFFDSFYILNGAEWTMSRCLGYAHVNAGLHIRNYPLSDAGDSCVSDCLFAADIREAAYGIFWESGSGVKFINNKVNWHENGGTKFRHDKAFFIRPAVPSSTPPASSSGETNGLNSLLLIQNNSFENFKSYGIHFDQTAGATSSFANIIIQGNEFQPAFADAAYGIVFDGPSSFRPTAITISGNILSNCKPIKLNNLDTVFVGTNICKSNNAGAALLELGTNCFRVKTEPQTVLWGTGSNAFTRQIFQDASAVGTSTQPKTLRNWKEARELPVVTTSDTNLYRIFTLANNGFRATLHVNAKDNLNNTIVSKQERLIAASSTNAVTTTVVNSDVSTLGANVTITWDVGTTGECTIKLKASGTASTLTSGYIILELEGEVYALNLGYAYSA